MQLAPMKDFLLEAREGKYAVGAFNCITVAELKGVIEAAAVERAPVIVQVYHGWLDHLGPELFVTATRMLIEQHGVPAAVCLDHAATVDLVRSVLDGGFTSVMIDGSKKPLRENISLTREVVKLARSYGASCEAELGTLGALTGLDESDASKFLTDPNEAKRFVEETGVDALAVAIGTAHGQYTDEPKLDFDRLEQLRDMVPVPLVLHGGTGIPMDAVRRAISLGINKVNIGTEIGFAFTRALRQTAEIEKDPIWASQLAAKVVEEVREVVRKKIEEFGSSGKAHNDE